MAATDTPETDKNGAAESDPARPLPGRAWWHRHLEPQERRRILIDLAISQVDHWAYRFVIMLTLSIIVAVMGLALNSAAVVIGAMLLAPLMQPVLAAGACISLALFTKSLIAFLKVMAATAWCIAIAYLISLILPEGQLSAEVLARTQPDIKDLVVALAAGAAGAYATVRADVSSSLPGVAVAVALVPPLAAVGITLEHGDTTLAYGALLLYFTNLAAIVFASIVVFVFTGFVTPRRISDNLLRLIVATLALITLVILIAVPLYRASLASIDRSNEQLKAEEIVAAWLGDRDAEVEQTVKINRDERQVVVDFRALELPLDQGTLIAEMQAAFPGYDVPVSWVRTQLPTTTTIPLPEPTEQLLAEIEVAVEAWLEESGVVYQIDNVLLDGSLVRIDAAGTADPPDIDALVPRLAAIDEALQPGLNWATLATITEEPAPSPIELTREDLRVVVERWAGERGLVIRAFDYDGEQIETEVSGSRSPDITRLERELLEVAGAEIPVRVYFTERFLVTTSTTSTLPPPTNAVPTGNDE